MIRYPLLDWVRVIGLFLVMATHFVLRQGGNPLLEWVFMRNDIAVDLFFVLSGFLVSSPLIRAYDRTGRVPFFRFWVRRWLRTVPVYLVVMWILLLSGYLYGNRGWLEYLFLQNYLQPSFWVISWSICVEEHFYFALPLVFWLSVRLKRRFGFEAVAVLLIFVSYGLRWYASSTVQTLFEYDRFVYGVTHYRLDSVLMGVLVALVRQRHTTLRLWTERHAGYIGAFGIALLLLTQWNPFVSGFTGGEQARFHPYLMIHAHFVAGIAGSCLVLWGVSPKYEARFSVPGLRWLADLVYPLYLIHTFCLQVIYVFVTKNYWGVLFLGLLFSLVLAVALRFLVEKPGLKLRDRLFQKPKRRHDPPQSLAPQAV